MTELEALKEVERLARECLADFNGKLEGECDGEYHVYETCDNEVTISERCECGKMVEIDFQCDAVLEHDEPCEKTVSLEPDADTQEHLRELRLALVQLDLARAKE